MIGVGQTKVGLVAVRMHIISRRIIIIIIINNVIIIKLPPPFLVGLKPSGLHGLQEVQMLREQGSGEPCQGYSGQIIATYLRRLVTPYMVVNRIRESHQNPSKHSGLGIIGSFAQVIQKV